ncbi:MAG: Gfo/Idh/MocA family oxidoreductase [Actinobacteria bacterium]|nr:Gfo/Idh/MocA family oxidoreductase [Actinomycetota bacterium]
MVLRVGIVGLGSIGATHAACLTELRDEARLVAYSSHATIAPGTVPVGNARRMAPEAVLAASDVDLVVVAGPSNLHGVHALAALRAGKHVVVEKPLATTSAAAREVVAAWREAGVMGSVIAQRRLESQHVELKRLLDEGRLGRPLLAQVQVCWWRPAEYYDQSAWRGQPPGGGVLMNQALHSVDLLVWLLGPAADVAAINGNLAHDLACEDSSVAAVRFRCGALGSIVATTATPPGTPATLRLYTDRGMIELEQGAITRWDVPGVPQPEAAEQVPSGAGNPAAIGVGGHLTQWRDILAAVRSGRQPTISLADGLDVVAMIVAVYAADATGLRQRVGEG